MKRSDRHSDARVPTSMQGGPRCNAPMALVGDGSAARRRVGRGRRKPWLAPLALLSALLGVMVWSAPALALSQRGHVFSFSFGKKGSGAGQFVKPSGVAVNDASGDVYVVDAGNNRVERFDREGHFVAAWGWGVSDGKAELETCTSTCQAGVAGVGEGQLDSPEAIAVDNSANPEDPSAGDVYVVADAQFPNAVVEKFTATGGYVGRLTSKAEGEAFGRLDGVATDLNGSVWVDWESGPIENFGDAEVNELLSSREPELVCQAPGLAVDATGEALYVNHQRANFEEECPEQAPSEKAPAVVAKLNTAGEPLIESLDRKNTTAVAVDLSNGQQSSGDVYLDNVTALTAFSADGTPIESLGAEAELSKGRGVGSSLTGELYVADAGKSRVDVFVPAPPAPSTVDGISSQSLDSTSTALNAQIDPHGLKTEYSFEYGTVDCAASPSSCTSVPVPPGTIEAGFGAQGVGVLLHDLQPGTTYYYRLIARNEDGEADAAQTLNTFTTLPSAAGLLLDNRAWELVSPPEKGGAGIEAIGGSAENGGPTGGPMQASADGSAVTYVANAPPVREPEGSRSPEGTQIISTRSAEAWSSQDIVTPHNMGEGFPAGKPQEYSVFSANLSLGLVEPWGLTGIQEPPLVPGVEEEERGIYLRRNTTCAATPASCYEPLVNAENDTAHARFGGKVGFLPGGGIVDASPDLRHVVFQSEVALTPTTAPGLYEWSAGKPPAAQLQLVSVLPNGKPAQEEAALGNAPSPGTQATQARNAISNDGSRVVWAVPGEPRLYMRDMSKGETLQVNAPAKGAKKLGKEEAQEVEEVHFQGSSSDGSRVFFTDTVPLTTESTLEPRREGPADLYVCEVEEVGGKLECGKEGEKLKDLTVDSRFEFGESADVVGLMLGSSEDGSSVYFVANGVLASGAAAGHCSRATTEELPGAKCNLYFEHYNGEGWEAPRFIAQLAQEDAADWGRGGTESLRVMTSRISPNGRYASFMSDEPLTGYDNVDTNPEAHGARDEEVFLYDSSSDRLVCASCNGGERPHGVLDTERSGEGNGLLVDRPAAWKGHWLAGSVPGWTPLAVSVALYQSRYLSNEGRLFFNAADGLVPQDKNGKEDVYEYEPTGVGGCEGAPGCVALISSGISAQESAFLDASESGDDAFFVTAQPLVAGDRDKSFDLYDARVCTEASPCLTSPAPPPPRCSGEEPCRPAPHAPPVLASPPSATFSGPGNVLGSREEERQPPKPTLTRAQRLKKALVACRKKYKRSKGKRVRCEQQARRTYAAKKLHRKVRR